MRTIVKRLRRDDDGYAIVIAMLLMAIMMVSLVVALNAGNAALRESQFGVRWAQTLSVAESGIDEAIVALTADRGAASSCPTGGTDVCVLDGGEYQVDWTTDTDGSMVLTSVGYYPTLAGVKYTRSIQVLMEPAPAFQYALFAEDDLEVKNNETIIGSMYSTGDVTIKAASGSITMENNSALVPSIAGTDCTDQDADAWAGGSILNSGTINGNAKASAPTGTVCNASSTSYQIQGGTVVGTATACGRITAAAGVSLAGTSSTPPTSESLPQFTFDLANYPTLSCYGGIGTCDPTNTSATAYSSFNTYKNAHENAMSGSFAIWQTSASQATKVDLEDITLSGDLTVVTNAPIDFGNTSTVTTVGGVPATLVVISLYEPLGACGTNGGDCSIYSKNQITFDDGDATDPTDGIAVLLYTTGKMAWKNHGAADGALYAGTMDIKNGFGVVYNSRIAKILGFGVGLEPVLWQELSD
jgi:hypothetical protein